MSSRYVRGRTANRGGARRITCSVVDPIAVERAVGGDRRLQLTAAERDAAIDALDALGLSAAQIAVRLGMTIRTVQRRRAERAGRTRENQAA